MEIKVSVIIPVYNAEKYIEECINSLLNQTLKEVEFIFIIDGSTDLSESIIRKYAEKDKRIIIYNQENKGISISRNKGIDLCSGEYIGFLDNDDYYDANMLWNLYTNAKKHDVEIIVSNTILERDSKKVIKRNGFEYNKVFNYHYIQENIVPNLLISEDLFALWNKLFKREFIINNKLYLKSNREIEEDGMFNLNAFNLCKKVIFIDYAGYNYRDVTTSHSRKTIERDFFKKSVEKLKKDYKNEFKLNLDEKFVEKLNTIRFINRVFYLFFKVSTDNGNFFKRYNYIKNMLFDNDTYFSVIKYKSEVLEYKNSFYNRILIHIVLNKSNFFLKIIFILINLLYNKFTSEILRNVK